MLRYFTELTGTAILFQMLDVKYCNRAKKHCCTGSFLRSLLHLFVQGIEF